MSVDNININNSISMDSAIGKRKSMVPFYFIIIFLAMEYGRPQELLSFISYLHIPAVVISLLTFYGLFIRRFRWDDKQTVLYLLLLGLMVIHGPIAVNNYWALRVFIAMVINFIAYLSICNYVDSEEKYAKLVSVWLVIHIFMAIIGIVNSGAGIGGFLGDENDFCMTLNMIIPFSFFLAIYSSGKNKMYYIILTSLFIFVIILTKSRGGFVGLSAMFLYCWLRTKRKIITGLFLAMLIGFSILVAPSDYWDEINTIQTEGASKGTGEERMYEWKIGWHIFLDNPFIGVGQGNFPFVFKKYEVEVMGGEDPFYGRSVAGRVAHSIYFTILPELGVVGLFIFTGLVYYNHRDLKIIKSISHNNYFKIKQNTSEEYYYYMALALEGSIIAYLVSGVFISILYYPNFWINMGLIISLRKIVLSKTDNPQVKKFSSNPELNVKYR